MRMNLNLNDFGAFGILIGVGGLIVAGIQAKKTHELSGKLSTSIENLEKRTPVEVEQDIIDEAVRRAVDKKVGFAVNEVADRVRNDIHHDIKNKVREEIKSNVERITEEVSETIYSQTEGIDKQQIVDSVTRKVEQKLIQQIRPKFDAKLDDMLGEFRAPLSTMGKVFDLAANAMSPREDKNDGLRIRLG